MSAYGRSEDQDPVLGAISSVLKMPLTMRDLQGVQMTHQGNKINFEYKGHSGFITRKDASDWNIEFKDILKVVQRGQRTHGKLGAAPHPKHRDWTRESYEEEQKRLMGINPTLREQVRDRDR